MKILWWIVAPMPIYALVLVFGYLTHWIFIWVILWILPWACASAYITKKIYEADDKRE